ncbi:MAG TPA: hypothetical protein VE843_15130 [Ktedonobacteraceae bacterium]|nr:hypothetical protein [Ktedonobacteraceae bacterium]
MTNTFKRRIYLWCVVSAASFLTGLLLYGLEDAGIATEQLIFPCAMLWMGGILVGFKALETWSGWHEDTSEDTNEDLNKSNLYPLTFYLEAAAGILIVVFLLVFTLSRNRPTPSEDAVLFFALGLAGACTGMGYLSSSLG